MTQTQKVVRLKRRRDFLAAARGGRKWAMPGLVLQARHRAPSEGEGNAVRVGFTVSRKVGKAVARNRARRRLKAAAAAVVGADVRPATDLVLIGRRATLHRPYQRLLRDLETALDKVGARGGRG